MCPRRIVTIGLQLASQETEEASFQAKTSLLDFDIVLFKPEIDQFHNYGDEYFQGKRSLNDLSSFELKECCAHWRREIKEALETGKTVIVFLPTLEEVYVDTGQRSFSGTGRNQRTTRHVAPYNNYEAIPSDLSPVTSTGNAMKLSERGSEILAPYWADFESISQYKVLLTNPKVPACIMTRTGDKTVGALYRSKSSAGALLLLPDIDFYSDEFVKARGENQSWTPAAKQFAERMIASVVALDKALRETSEVTPEPPWATQPQFALTAETQFRTQLLEAERKVEEAQRSKEELSAKLREAGAFRALLFEKGKPLEHAIIEALHVLGFTAAPFKDSDSEFDVVFESQEGRLIGEAEGKDNKPINIEKLRQLSMNVHEDLQRETITAPAKPVLFGNAYRLQQLNDRGDPFTDKCHRAAAISSTALVFTPDLFLVVQFLLSHADQDFARACREVLLTTTGRVTFPSLPLVEVQPSETKLAETNDA